jgi:hypothetical protein
MSTSQTSRRGREPAELFCLVEGLLGSLGSGLAADVRAVVEGAESATMVVGMIVTAAASSALAVGAYWMVAGTKQGTKSIREDILILVRMSHIRMYLRRQLHFQWPVVSQRWRWLGQLKGNQCGVGRLRGE